MRGGRSPANTHEGENLNRLQNLGETICMAIIGTQMAAVDLAAEQRRSTSYRRV
jgi:hypothetical protein